MNLLEIQQKLNVPKDQKNEFAGFNYRNAEGILAAFKALESGCVLSLSDDLVSLDGRWYVKATAVLIDDEGKTTTVSAFAREQEIKKGMDQAQITGAASSYARKYALGGLFLLDDSKLDPDSRDNRAPEEKKADKARDAKWESATPKQLEALKNQCIKQMGEADGLNGYKALCLVYAGLTQEQAGKIIRELNKGDETTVRNALEQAAGLGDGQKDIPF